MYRALDTKKTNTPEATLKTAYLHSTVATATPYTTYSPARRSHEQKERHHDIMELASEFQMQYDNYKILSKDVVGDTATLKVEIFLNGRKTSDHKRRDNEVRQRRQ